MFQDQNIFKENEDIQEEGKKKKENMKNSQRNFKISNMFS